MSYINPTLSILLSGTQRIRTSTFIKLSCKLPPGITQTLENEKPDEELTSISTPGLPPLIEKL